MIYSPPEAIYVYMTFFFQTNTYPGFSKLDNESEWPVNLTHYKAWKSQDLFLCNSNCFRRK